MTNTIKTYICEEMFQDGYPESVEKMHPFDFFMNVDIEQNQTVDTSPMVCNFEITSEYCFDNIKAIRAVMQSKLNDLLWLNSKLLTLKQSSFITSLRVAYIATSDLECLEHTLNTNGFGDITSRHTDNSNELEIWVENSTEVLQYLEDNNYLSKKERFELYRIANTIVFF